MKFEPTLHKLSNGVTVILDPMDAATAAIAVRFDTGSIDEKPSEYGITHFCEHMLCKGTRRFPTAQSIKDYVADNAGVSNAYTSNDIVQLHGMVLAENAEVLLGVFADQLQNSLFDPEKIELERTVIKDELRRALDSEDRQNSEFINNAVLGGTYPQYRTLGPVENISSFTRKQMKMFMARRMTGKNCVICVSGKIDNPDKLLATIGQQFGWMSPIDVPKNTPPASYNPAAVHYERMGKNNVDLMVVMPHIYQHNTDENRFQRMCINRFNAYLQQELYRVLRTENGLVYGVGQRSFGPEGAYLNGFETRTAPENVARVVALMAKTAREVYTVNPITDEFIKRDKNRRRLGDASWLESPEKRRDSQLNEYTTYGHFYDFNEILRMASQITAADVIKYTRGYFDKPLSILTTGANFDADVMQIWHENFGEIPKVQDIILAKDDKCR